jgi:hypothetical protein
MRPSSIKLKEARAKERFTLAEVAKTPNQALHRTGAVSSSLSGPGCLAGSFIDL